MGHAIKAPIRDRKSTTTPRASVGALLTLLVLASTACVGRQVENPLERSTTIRPVQVLVENDNWSDLTVYAVVGGSRMRLGVVGSSSTRRFTLRHRLGSGLDTFRFTARMMGGRSLETPSFTLPPGAEFQWTVGTSATTSHYMVRR